MIVHVYICITVPVFFPTLSFDQLSPHCVLPVGVLYEDGTIDNEASISRLAEVAVAYAKAGNTDSCHSA